MLCLSWTIITEKCIKEWFQTTGFTSSVQNEYKETRNESKCNENDIKEEEGILYLVDTLHVLSTNFLT